MVTVRHTQYFRPRVVKLTFQVDAVDRTSLYLCRSVSVPSSGSYDYHTQLSFSIQPSKQLWYEHEIIWSPITWNGISFL